MKKKTILKLIHFHRESSVERKMCPTQQHRHDRSPMDSTGRMNELYHDTSGHRETHFTSPFSGGPVAPLPSTSSATLHSGYFSHKSGVPRNHPFHDSVGRHAWNVPYPDKNRFQFRRPPPTVMVCLNPAFTPCTIIDDNDDNRILSIIRFYGIISRILWVVTLLFHPLRHICGRCIVNYSNSSSVIHLYRSLCSNSDHHLVIPLDLNLCLRSSWAI